MALRGNLTASTLVDVLQIIAQRTKTGVLEVEDDDRRVRIEIVDGRIVAAHAPDRAPDQRLLARLVRASWVTAAAADTVLTHQARRPSPCRVGDLLIEGGWADPARVASALERQMRETLLEIFFWESGTFRFERTSIDADPTGPPSLGITGILLDGLNLRQEWPNTRAALPPRETRLYRTAPPAEAASRLTDELEDTDFAVYDEIVDGDSLGRVIDRGTLDAFASSRSVLRLRAAGFLRTEVEGQREREATWSQLAATMDRAAVRSSGEQMPPAYEFVEDSGAWALGEVKSVVSLESRRVLRLKTVRAYPWLAQRFDQVLLILTRIQGPGLIEVLDHGVMPGGDFFVVLPPREPTTRIGGDPARPLERRQLLDFAVQAAQTLARVHRGGVLHNRLSAQSFSDVKGRGLMLVDLHESLLLALSPNANAATWSPYAAPERLHGGDVDARTDVYGLGAVLYEWVCGCSPFEIATRLRNRSLDPPPTFNRIIPEAALPGPIEVIIQRCLSPEPASRYPNAESLSRALLAMRNDVSLS